MRQLRNVACALSGLSGERQHCLMSVQAHHFGERLRRGDPDLLQIGQSNGTDQGSNKGRARIGVNRDFITILAKAGCKTLWRGWVVRGAFVDTCRRHCSRAPRLICAWQGGIMVRSLAVLFLSIPPLAAERSSLVLRDAPLLNVDRDGNSSAAITLYNTGAPIKQLRLNLLDFKHKRPEGK